MYFCVFHHQSTGEVFGGSLSKLDVGDHTNVEDQLTDLRLLTSYLENELNVMRQENADFRRDIMTSSLRNHAAGVGDRLANKMADSSNGTATKHGVARALPRGIYRVAPKT